MENHSRDTEVTQLTGALFLAGTLVSHLRGTWQIQATSNSPFSRSPDLAKVNIFIITFVVKIKTKTTRTEMQNDKHNAEKVEQN